MVKHKLARHAIIISEVQLKTFGYTVAEVC